MYPMLVGHAAVQQLTIDVGVVNANQLTFVLATPAGVLDPLAPGQTITDAPETAAAGLVAALKLNYTIAGFTAVGNPSELVCSSFGAMMGGRS